MKSSNINKLKNKQKFILHLSHYKNKIAAQFLETYDYAC